MGEVRAAYKGFFHDFVHWSSGAYRFRDSNVVLIATSKIVACSISLGQVLFRDRDHARRYAEGIDSGAHTSRKAGYQ